MQDNLCKLYVNTDLEAKALFFPMIWQMLNYNMDFSISAILSSLIFSTVGFYVLREGRKRPDFKLVIIGILLMAFSYFTRGPWLDWGLGFILCGVTYFYWVRNQL